MPKHPKRPRDPNQLAKFILDLAMGDAADSKPSEMSVPGRAKGGKAGGAARAKALSSEKRSEIAKKAAKKRWDRK
jgi:hypothetical protein